MTEPARPPAHADAPGRHPGFGSGARLWLLRHAEVSSEWRGIAYGDLDVPLGDEGLAATAELGRSFGALGAMRLLGSPLSRARALGEAIAGTSGAELELDESLREIHRGRWQGTRVDELDAGDVADFYADPWNYRGHGGESDSDVLARAWPVVERALAGDADAPREPVVIVAHYNVIRVVVAHALGIPASASFSLRVDPGHGVALLDADRDPAKRVMAPGWILLQSNVARPGVDR